MPLWLLSIGGKLLGLGRLIRNGVGWVFSDLRRVLAAACLLLLVLSLMLSAGLRHAKAALLDPATHKPWSNEAKASQADLARARQDLSTCQGNTGRLTAALDAQTAAAARAAAETRDNAASTRQAVAAAHAKTLAMATQINKLEAERAKPGETKDQACGRILLDGVEDE